jgi:hypothetical protein
LEIRTNESLFLNLNDFSQSLGEQKNTITHLLIKLMTKIQDDYNYAQSSSIFERGGMEIENDDVMKTPLELKREMWKSYSKFCEKAVRMLEGKKIEK